MKIKLKMLTAEQSRIIQIVYSHFKKCSIKASSEFTVCLNEAIAETIGKELARESLDKLNKKSYGKRKRTTRRTKK